MLDELLERIASFDEETRNEAAKSIWKATAGMPFVPSPGPQFEAYVSEADILLYGGEPGGGKTGLLIGLGLNDYDRSLIVRKQFSDLEGVIDNAKAMLGTEDGFVLGQRPKYKKPNGGVISFEGMPSGGMVDTGKQGNAREYIGVDEGAQLSEAQVRILFGWIRRLKEDEDVKIPRKKCRMVIASNPPLDPVGDWMVDFFGPWLNTEHPNPAENGELRWFIFDDQDKSLEVEGPGFYYSDGTPYKEGEEGRETRQSHSRTFIRSTVDDNPFLDSDDYKRRIDIMPEPFRSILKRGNFMMARQDQPFQVIPTSWLREAQTRWKPDPYPGVPMCAIGVDVARGGSDRTVIASRYDGWYAMPIVKPGIETPRGTDVAGLVIANRRDMAHVVVDMGGGYGGAPLEHLEANIGEEFVHAHVPSGEATSRTADGSLGFANKRSQIWWEFREALDPARAGGSFIALPPDTELIADLSAPTFYLSNGKIQVESKDDGVDSNGKPKPGLKKRLGRSPDKGDAVVMAWSEGNRALLTHIAHEVPGYMVPKSGRSSGITVKDKHANKRRSR